MMVEITEVSLNQGVVTIVAVDCSEENLQRMERMRDDGPPVEMEFNFNTHRRSDYTYLHKWLKSQKCAKTEKTWGDALRSVCGTVTTISGRFRVWN